MFEFKLPEVGENIESGTIVKIFVAVGDTITKDQDLIELETDKASLPVPSPVGGVVKEILVKEGDEIKVGSVVLTIEESAAAEKSSAPESKPVTEQKSTPEAPKTESQPKPAAVEETVPTENKSVVVIGGGPGGYTAAFMAADLGLDVTLIDLDVNPGGVCLYRGCIPSKALLHAAKVLSEAKEAANFGIEFGRPKIYLDKLRAWKNSVVDRLTSGLGQLAKQRKVKFIQGRCTFVDSNTLNIAKADGSNEELKFEKAILATGSRPIMIPNLPDSPRILDSTTALDIESVPETMLLVGGGYIGLELGTVYAELGSELDVVEMLPTLMAGADRDVANILEKRLKTILRDIMVETKVAKIEEVEKGLKVTFEDKDGKTFDKEYEKVLMAIGRRPNTENIGLEKTKITLNEQKFIDVNAQMQTADPSIFAIGDIVGQPMLAHKASHEGIVAAETIAGHKVAFEPNAIPCVVFTDPEIAWCGLTETEAKAQNRNYVVQKFPWAASGRAITLDRTDGLTKLLIDPDTERILGVSIVGAGAGEMIAEGVLALEMGALASDLKLTIHPHPTLSETIMEAAESFYGQSTHIYRPKRK